MAAVILSQVATSLLAPGIYGIIGAGASIGASSALWAVSQGLAGFAGAMVGSAIDRAIFGGPQSAEGPRLSDLTVQSSTDGAPLPRVFGTMRQAGNVIWSTGLEEIRHEESAGGGSGGGATVTTYTYQTDVAVALCEGEIAGIRRIWADTKLVYDISAGAGVSTLLASMDQAADIRIYPGSESQDPDPLIQSVEGIDSAPAYRGTAYAVFEDLQLADFGNRIPNFTFEVVTEGSEAGVRFLESYPVQGLPVGYSIRMMQSYEDGALTAIGFDNGGSFGASPTYYPADSRAFTVPVVGGLAAPRVVAESHLPNIANGGGGTTYSQGRFAQWYVWTTSAGLTTAIGAGPIVKLTPTNDSTQAGRYVEDHLPGSESGRYIIGLCVDETRTRMLVVTASASANSADYWYLLDPDMNILDSGTCAAGIDYQHLAIGMQHIGRGAMVMEADLVHIWSAMQISGQYAVYLMSIDEAGVMSKTTASGAEVFNTEPRPSALWATDGLLFLFTHKYLTPSTFEHYVQVYTRVGALTPTPVSLDAVTATIIESAGLSASDYDVSALASDTVRGYTLGRPMAMRAALEPLMLAYHFDLVEQDGQIVAVKRGGARVATLGTDDLGASENPDGGLVAVTRNNESELPSEVAISYSDIDTDYQAAVQYARRLTARHQNKVTLTLPMALTSTEAARLAEIALNAAWWSSRLSLQFSTTFEQLRLAPADPVDMPVYGQAMSVRLTEMTFGAPGLMQISAVPDLPSLWTGTAVGADAVNLSQTLGLSGPMRGLLLDCVMLRDQDNDPGLYAAACGYVSTWTGGATFKSNDGGATWTQVVAVTSGGAASIGYATTVLGNADCRFWDAANTVTVRLLNGTLSSATETAVLNGANAALLGAHGRWELIQFKTATLNADGSYTLTNLLRGRKGTEWAASQHAIYDTFILASASTLQDIPLTSSEIGATRHYKHVTAGQAIESVGEESFVYAGERLECLAPVLLGGGRDASGNITINWTRRNRINGAWNNYADVPMSESSESYEVDIYTDATYGTVKRTLTGISSTTTSYSSANQVTDFGGNQATIYVRVYQLSATTGRGHYLQGSL